MQAFKTKWFAKCKNERANIGVKELKALKLLAREVLSYKESVLATAIKAGELIEVQDDG